MNFPVIKDEYEKTTDAFARELFREVLEILFRARMLAQMEA